MYHPGARLLAGTIPLWLIACSDPSPTSVAPPGAPVVEALADLAIAAPLPASADLANVDRSAIGVPALSGPFRAEGDDDFTAEDPAEIYSARTNVGFDGTGAFAEGSHHFTGNGGRIETKADVTFDGRSLGSQTEVVQRTWWLSLEPSHFLTALSRVYSDTSCGLAVKGSSVHQAWVEVFSGKSSTIWGRAEQTTSKVAAQEECGKRISTGDPTHEYSSEGGLVCYYLVTYDLDTLEIVAVEFLRCQSGGGDLI